MNEGYPVRVGRREAMALLCVADSRTFKKVVDANPKLKHRLPGETRWRYLRVEIVRLLSPTANSTVCDPRGGK
jgi:hypothetical protein